VKLNQLRQTENLNGLLGKLANSPFRTGSKKYKGIGRKRINGNSIEKSLMIAERQLPMGVCVSRANS
jgi:hypothetical protein